MKHGDKAANGGEKAEMWHDWRAPACYLSVGLLCMIYVWIMPLAGLTDLLAGAGIGAAAMWALNDWESRQQRRAQAGEGEGRLSVILSRVDAVFRAARGIEARPSLVSKTEADELRQLARVIGAIEESMAASRSSKAALAPREQSTEVLKSEALARDIETMEERLRALSREVGASSVERLAPTRARAAYPHVSQNQGPGLLANARRLEAKPYGRT